MARTFDTPAANPEIQPIVDEILRNWALADIHAAPPYRLSPSRRDTAIRRPWEQSNWSRGFLERLRDLSELTKDKHDAVKTHLANRIDWRRGPKAAKTHTKEQWTIIEDLEWAMRKKRRVLSKPLQLIRDDQADLRRRTIQSVNLWQTQLL
jgi:hypothetical protein